jgi:hypothetical protein
LVSIKPFFPFSPDICGCTALILAARASHVATIKLFLERDDVNVNDTTIRGASTLSISRNTRHEAVVETLLAFRK